MDNKPNQPPQGNPPPPPFFPMWPPLPPPGVITPGSIPPPGGLPPPGLIPPPGLLPGMPPGMPPPPWMMFPQMMQQMPQQPMPPAPAPKPKKKADMEEALMQFKIDTEMQKWIKEYLLTNRAEPPKAEREQKKFEIWMRLKEEEKEKEKQKKQAELDRVKAEIEEKARKFEEENKLKQRALEALNRKMQEKEREAASATPQAYESHGRRHRSPERERKSTSHEVFITPKVAEIQKILRKAEPIKKSTEPEETKVKEPSEAMKKLLEAEEIPLPSTSAVPLPQMTPPPPPISDVQNLESNFAKSVSLLGPPAHGSPKEPPFKKPCGSTPGITSSADSTEQKKKVRKSRFDDPSPSLPATPVPADRTPTLAVPIPPPALAVSPILTTPGQAFSTPVPVFRSPGPPLPPSGLIGTQATPGKVLSVPLPVAQALLAAPPPPPPPPSAQEPPPPPPEENPPVPPATPYVPPLDNMAAHLATEAEKLDFYDKMPRAPKMVLWKAMEEDVLAIELVDEQKTGRKLERLKENERKTVNKQKFDFYSQIDNNRFCYMKKLFFTEVVIVQRSILKENLMAAERIGQLQSEFVQIPAVRALLPPEMVQKMATALQTKKT